MGYVLQFSQNAYSLACTTSKFSVEGDRVFFIFQSDKRLVNADAAGFALIPDSTDACNNNNYGRDRDGVFNGANKIEGADPASFQAVTGARYIFKDKNSVFLFNKSQPGIDSASFMHIKTAFKYGSYPVSLFRDKISMLILLDEHFKRLTNVDPATTKLMGGDTDNENAYLATDVYVVDKDQVLHGKTLALTKFKPDSFETQGPYTKDKHRLECAGRQIDVTKPSSIILRNDGIATFDNKALLRCKTLFVGIDPVTIAITFFRVRSVLKEVVIDVQTIFDMTGKKVCLRGKNDSEGLPTCK
jgi:hypothetical protein